MYKRQALGWPARGNSVAQPWVIEPETITHHITLRFTIDSEITVSSPVLAIEDAESVKITLNGEPTPSRVTGYYVDAVSYTHLRALHRSGMTKHHRIFHIIL